MFATLHDGEMGISDSGTDILPIWVHFGLLVVEDHLRQDIQLMNC